MVQPGDAGQGHGLGEKRVEPGPIGEGGFILDPVAVPGFVEFVGIAVLVGRSAGHAALEGKAFVGPDDIVVQLSVNGCNILQIAEPDRVRGGHEPGDSLALGIDEVIGPLAPDPVKSKRPVVGIALVAQGLFEQGLEVAVDPMSRGATPQELPVHQPIRIGRIPAGAKALPMQRNPQKIPPDGVEQGPDGAIPGMDYQKLIDIADQQPVGGRDLWLSAHLPVGRLLGWACSGVMAEMREPARTGQGRKQCDRMVGAVIGGNQHLKPEHPVPSHPFNNEGPFIAHRRKNQKFFIRCRHAGLSIISTPLASIPIHCYRTVMSDHSDNLRGAAMMAGSMACFTINDAFLKILSDSLPLFQVILLRGCVTSAFMIGLALWMGLHRIRVSRRDWWRIGVRTVAEAGAAWFFITALFHVDFANVAAIMQSLPLTITLAGALFLGDKVGWRRWAAILIGFAGVMLIVKPGGGGFTVYSVYVLASVACVTLRDIMARQVSAQVPSLLVAVVAALGVTLFAGVGALFVEWKPLTAGAGWSVLGSAVFVIGGYILSVQSMRIGEISFVAPFRYTSLLVALILGVVVFKTFPDGWTLVGAAIVVATGLFTLYRERAMRLARG